MPPRIRCLPGIDRSQSCAKAPLALASRSFHLLPGKPLAEGAAPVQHVFLANCEDSDAAITPRVGWRPRAAGAQLLEWAEVPDCGTPSSPDCPECGRLAFDTGFVSASRAHDHTPDIGLFAFQCEECGVGLTVSQV
jgi:hypothetical protein